jgi:hypothetical protein
MLPEIALVIEEHLFKGVDYVGVFKLRGSLGDFFFLVEVD